jgi:hypothetical protein
MQIWIIGVMGFVATSFAIAEPTPAPSTSLGADVVPAEAPAVPVTAPVSASKPVKPKSQLETDYPHIPSLGETEEDSPWSGITRKLLSDVQVNIPSLVTLRTTLPALCHKMDVDSNLSAYKELWGKSLNFDQDAKKTIVNPEVLKNLAVLFGSPDYAEMAKTPGGTSVTHSGFAHTYGYLFSNAKTQYGFKRERWVRGEMEKGFGMPEGPLHPLPPRGTLFSNATYFFGKIAFRQEPDRLRMLSKHAGQVSPAIRNLSLGKLKLIRIVETIQMKSGSESDRKVEFRTDLVPFTHPSGSTNTHMLIYSIHDSTESGAQLITGFPVTSNFVTMLTNPIGVGEGKSIQLRYNAYVEGVWGRTFTGSRKIISVPAIL